MPGVTQLECVCVLQEVHTGDEEGSRGAGTETQETEGRGDRCSDQCYLTDQVLHTYSHSVKELFLENISNNKLNYLSNSGFYRVILCVGP